MQVITIWHYTYKASDCKCRLNIIGSRRGGNWENIYHGNEETTPREQTKSAAGPKLRGFKIDKAGVDRSRRFIRCNKYIVTLYIGWFRETQFQGDFQRDYVNVCRDVLLLIHNHKFKVARCTADQAGYAGGRTQGVGCK